MAVYQPGEDSLFLSSKIKEYLKNKNKGIRILDIGSGSGIQAETCLKSGFENISVADIDNRTITHLKKKFKNKIKSVKSDLFKKITGKFNLIIFNPPYLPENKYDKKRDTTGGKKGDETILRFLEQAGTHLTKRGEILLLLSSLTPRTRTNQLIKKHYKKQILAEKAIFFEKLEIWLLSPNLPINNAYTNNCA